MSSMQKKSIRRPYSPKILHFSQKKQGLVKQLNQSLSLLILDFHYAA